MDCRPDIRKKIKSVCALYSAQTELIKVPHIFHFTRYMKVVSTLLRFDRIFNDDFVLFVADLLLKVRWKFWKSVSLWWSYGQENGPVYWAITLYCCEENRVGKSRYGITTYMQNPAFIWGNPWQSLGEGVPIYRATVERSCCFRSLSTLWLHCFWH